MRKINQCVKCGQKFKHTLKQHMTTCNKIPPPVLLAAAWYSSDNQTVYKLSLDCGVDQNTISKWLKNAGIPNDERIARGRAVSLKKRRAKLGNYQGSPACKIDKMRIFDNVERVPVGFKGPRWWFVGVRVEGIGRLCGLCWSEQIKEA